MGIDKEDFQIKIVWSYRKPHFLPKVHSGAGSLNVRDKIITKTDTIHCSTGTDFCLRLLHG